MRLVGRIPPERYPGTLVASCATGLIVTRRNARDCLAAGLPAVQMHGSPDPHSPGRAIVEDTETRTALALAYRQRVEAEPATCGPGDATPQGNQSRHSLATTGTEGEHAFRTPAAENADSRDADHHQEQAQRQDKAGRATRDADVPPSARDLPDARDVLPNIQLAELDARKLSDYSLKPGHPGNNGKANGWRALGYDVGNPEGRRDAARELRGLICDELLARGKIAETRRLTRRASSTGGPSRPG